MKLKKIVSLALAGILAVSMLTACGDNGSSSSEGETEVTPVSGAAALINAELSENKGEISFTDDTTLDNVVKAYYSDSNISAADWKSKTMEELTTDAGKLNSVVKANKTGWSALETLVEATDTSNKTSALVVFGFNAKMFTKESVLKYVGQNVDQLELAEVNDAGTKNYVYTGTVSVNEVKSKGGEASIWVVTMEVTKDLADK